MGNLVTVYVVSDSIGETGELIAKAAVKQFVPSNFEIKRYPYIVGREQIKDIFDDAKKQKSTPFTRNLVIHGILNHPEGKKEKKKEKLNIRMRLIN